MGFIQKAVDKKKREIKAAAKKKAVSVARDITPGLCSTTGGRHQYRDHNKGGTPVLACKCGKAP